MAMLRYGTGVFMSLTISLDRWAIYSCMYMRNVKLDHQPCFIIVVLEWLWSFRTMAPPACKEYTHTRSRTMPFLCNAQSWTALCIVAIIISG
eukprot:6250869-Ditylum_brightwellii.AAC.1